MKKVNMILNIVIALIGVELMSRMLFTYNNPIGVGAMWIGLVSLKSIIEVFKKENM